MSDCTVRTKGDHHDVSCVYRAVLYMNCDTVFDNINAGDALPREHPFLVFELVEENL